MLAVERRDDHREQCVCSTVTLGDSLDFILLPDGSGIACRSLFGKTRQHLLASQCQFKSERLTYLGSVDDLVGEGLRNGLQASEGGLTGSLADQVNGLVDSAEGRHVDSLSTNNTTRSDTGGVLTGASVGDGGNHDLDGVLTGEKMNQFHGLLDNFDSLLLFTVVPAGRGHEHACHALNNGALDLLESALLVAASSVRNEHLLAHGLHLEVV